MKKHLVLFLSLFIVLSCEVPVNKIPSEATQVVKRIKMNITDPSQLDTLSNLSETMLDERPGSGKTEIWVEYTQERLAELNQKGIEYEVVDQTQSADPFRKSDITSQRSVSTTGYNYSVYHTYDQMVSELNQYTANNPSIAKIYQLTTTHQGHKVYAIKISKNVSQRENEPRLLVTGATHGNEIMGTEVCMYFIYYLISNYNTDTYIKNIIDTREIWVVPMLNPDGHVLIENNGMNLYNNSSVGRKNGRGLSSANLMSGVNLNRNFGYKWGLESGSSSNPNDPNYRGQTAFSEPESIAIRNLMISEQFNYVLDYHSAGGEVAQPWGYTFNRTPHYSIYSHMSGVIATMLNQNANVNYYYNPRAFYYLTSGDQCDYTYGEQNEKPMAFQFAIELNNQASGGFVPPTALIETTVKANITPLLYLLNNPASNTSSSIPNSLTGNWNQSGGSYTLQINSNGTFSATGSNGKVFTGPAQLIKDTLILKWTRSGNASEKYIETCKISNNQSSLSCKWYTLNGYDEIIASSTGFENYTKPGVPAPTPTPTPTPNPVSINLETIKGQWRSIQASNGSKYILIVNSNGQFYSRNLLNGTQYGGNITTTSSSVVYHASTYTETCSVSNNNAIQTCTWTSSSGGGSVTYSKVSTNINVNSPAVTILGAWNSAYAANGSRYYHFVNDDGTFYQKNLNNNHEFIGNYSINGQSITYNGVQVGKNSYSFTEHCNIVSSVRQECTWTDITSNSGVEIYIRQ